MSVLYLIAGVGLLGGGPDGFGYTYLSTQDGDAGVSFEWVDVAADPDADTIALGDDATGTLPIGFTFPIYDSTYDSILVGSNGALGFDLGGYISFSNRALPYYDMDFIAVLWDDLSPNVSGAAIYYNTYTNCPDAYDGACFVIQWDSVPHYGQSFGQTFEAILYDNGNIKLQYLVIDTNYNTSVTIGIHAADTSSASNKVLQYVYNGDPASHVPVDSVAILFVRPYVIPDLTIAEIQGTMLPGSDSSAYVGDTVRTSGIVVSKGAKSGKGLHIKMKDGGPYSGIMVFVSDTTGGFGSIQEGDSVVVVGQVKEFYGYTEIVSPDMSYLTIVSSGNTYALDTVTGSMVSNDNPDTAEMYEGVLVHVDSAVVDSQGTYYYYLHDATGAFLLDDNNIDPLVPGSIIRVTGIEIYSYGEYKLLARSNSDIEVISVPTPEPPLVTIDTVQRTMDASYASVFVGDTVRLIGVVTSTGVSGTRNIFLAQNPYGPYRGLLGYVQQGIPSFLNEGDSVLVTGVITEYYGNTEIVVYDTTLIQELGTGTIPDAIVVPAGYVDTSSTSSYAAYQPDTAEAYEHVLVKAETLQITGYDNSGFYGWYMVQAAKGNDTVYFKIDTTWGIPNVGDYYNVTGYVVTRANLYVLVPRSATDLEQITGQREDLSKPFVKLDRVSREGIVIRYNLKKDSPIDVRVYAINGRMVLRRVIRPGTGYGTLSLRAPLHTGVYIIHINGNRYKTIVR